ncbi:MAG: hypothetical protein KA116_09205 [Proteobacteria bacterium]|nr:hypothetical protein [Pseudomonadota bacterium]
MFTLKRRLARLFFNLALFLFGYQVFSYDELIKISKKVSSYSISNNEYFELKIPIGYDYSTEKISYSFLPRVTLRVRNNEKGEKEITGYIIHSYNDAEGRGWSNYQIFEKSENAFSLIADDTVNITKKKSLSANAENRLNKFFSGNLILPVENRVFLKADTRHCSNIQASELLRELRKGTFANKNSILLDKLNLSESSVFPNFYFPEQKYAFDESSILETLLTSKGNSNEYKAAIAQTLKEGKSIDSFLKEVTDPKFLDKKVEAFREELKRYRDIEIHPKIELHKTDSKLPLDN